MPLPSSNAASINSNSNSSAPGTPGMMKPPVDDLARVFNTAVVSTQAGNLRDFSLELHEVMESPAYRAILNSVRQLARLQGLSERQAAEQVMKTFRRLDELWRDYVFQEGVERLRGPQQS